MPEGRTPVGWFPQGALGPKRCAAVLSHEQPWTAFLVCSTSANVVFQFLRAGYMEERRVQIEAREASLPVMERAWKAKRTR